MRYVKRRRTRRGRSSRGKRRYSATRRKTRGIRVGYRM